MTKISGYVCVRNNWDLDYCAHLAVESLLPVCDEVIVSDGESTDGTLGFFVDWMKREPKLTVLVYPWPDPNQRIGWWTDWINHARQYLHFPMQLHLDADEVLDPSSYPAVRRFADAGEGAWFHRLNYWKDAAHLAPHGTACAHEVARLAPSHHWMPSDGPADVEPNARSLATGRDPSLVIHHYGFLRDTKAFVKKSEVVQRAFFGSVDQRIKEAQDSLGDWRERDYFDGRPLLPATHPHPEFCKPWLRARGFDV